MILKSKIKKINIKTLAIFTIVLVLLSYDFYLTRIPTKNFPVGEKFLVQENENLKSISTRLEEDHIVNYALLFRVWVSAYGKDRQLNSGQYIFDKPLVLGSVVQKMIGPADKPLLQVTIPEGSTDKQIAMIINREMPEISIKDFLAEIAKQNVSGELFPETYFLLPSYGKEDIVKLLHDTFTKKYIDYTKDNPKLVKMTLAKMQDIGYTSKNYNEGVINMAAILQGEGKYYEDMRIISGILWKRLLTNMTLQVDVAKETYKRKGLAKNIINNPGMYAIEAVFNPTQSEYLYYITGKDGNMYYAKTFTEHKKNIAKYLK